MDRLVTDFVVWLRAQLDEDEQIARAANVDLLDWIIDEDGSAHFARWHPVRVVAEVDAKRRILAAHPHQEYGAEWCGRCTGQEGHESWPCTTLRLLALPYAGRPGYRQEWRPT